jgi:hypothetical protein
MLLDPASRICCATPANTSHQGTCPNSVMRCGEDRTLLNHIVTRVGEFPISEKDWDLAQMHLLSTSRIGWETKQEYLHRLIDAYSNGYLTEPEYEARKKHVENAQTEEQIKTAFKDLSALKVTAVKPAPHLQRERTLNRDIGIAIVFTIAGFSTVITGTQHNPTFFIFIVITAIALTALLVNVVENLKR